MPRFRAHCSTVEGLSPRPPERDMNSFAEPPTNLDIGARCDPGHDRRDSLVSFGLNVFDTQLPAEVISFDLPKRELVRTGLEGPECFKKSMF